MCAGVTRAPSTLIAGQGVSPVWTNRAELTRGSTCETLTSSVNEFVDQSAWSSQCRERARSRRHWLSTGRADPRGRCGPQR